MFTATRIAASVQNRAGLFAMVPLLEPRSLIPEYPTAAECRFYHASPDALIPPPTQWGFASQMSSAVLLTLGQRRGVSPPSRGMLRIPPNLTRLGGLTPLRSPEVRGSDAADHGNCDLPHCPPI